MRRWGGPKFLAPRELRYPRVALELDPERSKGLAWRLQAHVFAKAAEGVP